MVEQSAASPRPARLQGLDGLRGVAALAVVTYHYLYHAPEIYPQLGTPVWWARVGVEGVRLFFVISGFVIFMSLTGSTLRVFAIRRFIRLYPIYWVAAALTFTVVAIVGLPGGEVGGWDALVNITMIHRYVGVPSIEPAYWTLAIELAFYVQCAALWRLGLLTSRRLPVTLFAWFAAALAVDLLIGDRPTDSIAWIWQQVASSLPVFMLGICALQFYRGERDRRLYAFVAVVLAVYAVHHPVLAVSGAASTALLLLVLRFPRVPSWRPLLIVGEASYVLYLIHQNLGFVFMRALHSVGLGQAAVTALTFLAAIALAVAITYMIERPLRGYLTVRLLPARAAQPATRELPQTPRAATVER